MAHRSLKGISSWVRELHRPSVSSLSSTTPSTRDPSRRYPNSPCDIHQARRLLCSSHWEWEGGRWRGEDKFDVKQAHEATTTGRTANMTGNAINRQGRPQALKIAARKNGRKEALASPVRAAGLLLFAGLFFFGVKKRTADSGRRNNRPMLRMRSEAVRTGGDSVRERERERE